ncbi:MAG: ACP S-malonyltransferase [Xenococcaceae cyanobacterium]
MTKTAWVFPGQGSQAVGMGADLKEITTAKDKFERAEQVLGWSVLEMCQGDEAQLSRTLYTQPCLYVIESILVDILNDKGYEPKLVAGHSLGEYVALYAAGVFDFESGLRLVKRRAELMDVAAGGKMVALMKFDRAQLERELDNASDVVLANDNSEGQVVISGTPEAVDGLVDRVKAKRAVALKVSGAFHSPLMAFASEQFEEVLQTVRFSNARVPILSNFEPIATTNAEEIKERIRKQITGSVRWRETMEQLSLENVSQVLEIGPGKVLSGLIKRACANVETKNFGNLADLVSL